MNFTLFGVSLTVIALSLTKAIQAIGGLNDQSANYVRAALMGLAYLLFTLGPGLASQYPWFEGQVTLWGGFLAVVLGVLGYWIDVQRISAKAQGKL